MPESEQKLHIEYMPLSDLVTRYHPDNPKDHHQQAITESILDLDYRMPVMLDEVSELLAAGHGRLKALSNMKRNQLDAPPGIQEQNGDWLVPTIRGSDFTEAQLKAYLVADNRLTELGGWDTVKLAVLLQEVANEGEVGLKSTGYDAEDLDDLLRELNPEFPEYDESIEDTVEWHECSECGHKWPK